MKIVVLVSCYNNNVSEPKVFKTMTEAKKYLSKYLDEALYKRDTDGEIIDVYNVDIESGEDWASIAYLDDDCGENIELFELEV